MIILFYTNRTNIYSIFNNFFKGSYVILIYTQCTKTPIHKKLKYNFYVNIEDEFMMGVFRNIIPAAHHRLFFSFNFFYKEYSSIYIGGHL